MKFEIQKKDQHYSFEAEEGQKLLYAGLRAGIALPYECATGTCGTCRARLKTGDIDEGWLDAPGKANLKSERREFLLCQAHAKGTDSVLDDSSEHCQLGIPAAIKPFRDDDVTPDYHSARVGNWRQLTKDVVEFDVVLDRDVQFHAGQFYVMKVSGVEGYRAYSMINHDVKTSTLTFVLKSKPEGAFSAWAFERNAKADTASDQISVFGPLGRATFHPDENKDLFMIAGGSGIAGIMSILRHGAAIDYFQNHKATVFFGVRTVDDAFYVSELNEIKEQFPENIAVHMVFSDQTVLPDDGKDLGSIEAGFGFVHEQALATISPGLTDTIVYLAGPPPMVDALIRPLIIEAKLPADSIRYDKFG